MWVHEHSDWPEFSWDQGALSSQLARMRHHQGLLLGQMKMMDHNLRQEAHLKTLTQDVVSSAAIEGEHLDVDHVRTLLSYNLGLGPRRLFEKFHPQLEGMVYLTLNVMRGYREPLTKERMFFWHSILFPTGLSGGHRISVGRWRGAELGPMEIISGASDKRKVHYRAPDGERVDGEMERFFHWYNQKHPDIDPVLKAGIAHLWFENIHPFEDGNGRIGRIVCDMMLTLSEGLGQRFYSLSSQIAAEREDYYAELEKQGRGSLEITSWLQWFLGCLERSFLRAEKNLSRIFTKAQIWKRVHEKTAESSPAPSY